MLAARSRITYASVRMRLPNWLARLLGRTDDGFVIEPGVDPDEFGRLLARALLDPRASQIAGPLFKANGGRVTPREVAWLRYLLGEVEHDKVVNSSPKSEGHVFYRQVRIVKRALKSRP